MKQSKTIITRAGFLREERCACEEVGGEEGLAGQLKDRRRDSF